MDLYKGIIEVIAPGLVIEYDWILIAWLPLDPMDICCGFER